MDTNNTSMGSMAPALVAVIWLWASSWLLLWTRPLQRLLLLLCSCGCHCHQQYSEYSSALVLALLLLLVLLSTRERDRRDWEQREAVLLQQQEEEQARRTAHRNAVKELSGLTQVNTHMAGRLMDHMCVRFRRLLVSNQR